jgi:hypothetical protein
VAAGAATLVSLHSSAAGLLWLLSHRPWSAPEQGASAAGYDHGVSAFGSPTLKSALDYLGGPDGIGAIEHAATAFVSDALFGT